MNTATITFSNGDTLEVKEYDNIIPIKLIDNKDDKPSASMARSIQLEFHSSDGLIPPLMDALCSCDFFYLNNSNAVYGTKTIVKIENN